MHPALRTGPLFSQNTPPFSTFLRKNTLPHFISCLRAWIGQDPICASQHDTGLDPMPNVDDMTQNAEDQEKQLASRNTARQWRVTTYTHIQAATSVQENVCNNSKKTSKVMFFLKFEKKVLKNVKKRRPTAYVVGLRPTQSFTGRSITQPLILNY